jgi:hypothetical protein
MLQGVDEAIKNASKCVTQYLQKEAEASCEELEAFQELNCMVAQKLKALAAADEIKAFEAQKQAKGNSANPICPPFPAWTLTVWSCSRSSGAIFSAGDRGR